MLIIAVAVWLSTGYVIYWLVTMSNPARKHWTMLFVCTVLWPLAFVLALVSVVFHKPQPLQKGRKHVKNKTHLLTGEQRELALKIIAVGNDVRAHKEGLKAQAEAYAKHRNAERKALWAQLTEQLGYAPEQGLTIDDSYYSEHDLLFVQEDNRSKNPIGGLLAALAGQRDEAAEDAVQTH